MKILAIETSCDETSVAVVVDGREILSNVINSQIKEHELYGGVVPEIASRRHCENIVLVTKMALQDANLTLDDIDAVAVTYAPGLIGALLVGLNFAKTISMTLNKPLIPVHHLRGHIAANYLSFKELEPPFICLVVSGGHSHIINVLSYTNYKVIGRTFDDAAGEAFDKVARCLGFPYPGGIYIDNNAKNGNPLAYHLPEPKVSNNPYDFSFSGLKTAVINLVHNTAQKGEELIKEDICASFQHTICSILTKRTILAAKDNNINKVVLAGGVSANSGLRELMEQKCKEDSLKLYYPALSLCVDNAAMIGSQAYYEYINGKSENKSFFDYNLNSSASLSIV